MVSGNSQHDIVYLYFLSLLTTPCGILSRAPSMLVTSIFVRLFQLLGMFSEVKPQFTHDTSKNSIQWKVQPQYDHLCIVVCLVSIRSSSLLTPWSHFTSHLPIISFFFFSEFELNFIFLSHLICLVFLLSHVMHSVCSLCFVSLLSTFLPTFRNLS